jgi:sugar phosphate isomerase/epimerase
MTTNSRGIPEVNRRAFLGGCAGLLLGSAPALALAQEKSSSGKDGGADRATIFQIACMTLPYSQFPLQRALTGLKEAGYKFVAWGTSHKEEGGKSVPVMPADASPDRAKELAKRCRDLGLEPLMLFSGVYPEAANHLDVFKSRIRQAAAAGVKQVLTFGHTKRGDRKRWVEHFKALGPIARDNGVLIVLKPHGGLTADGERTHQIVREIADEAVKANYDAGNVMDYLRIEPAAVLADLKKCASEVRSFCIKDHRSFPEDQDCGPGLGEIDHYRLLAPVAFTGRTIPLCCENIFAPAIPRPGKPEGIDVLARRAREFLELVIQGVQVRRPRPGATR